MTKDQAHFFGHIYLQFLQVLRKNNLILRKRQNLIIIKGNLGFQFVQIFWKKFMDLINIQNILINNKTFGEQIIQFKIRFEISQMKLK